MSQRVVINLSGGVCSWAAGKLAAQTYGTEAITCLFADTLIEDDDLYRFLIETAANIVGCPRPNITALQCIPSLWHMDERKACLVEIRGEAMAAIPQLKWIADGRHPWEVFKDERFIGNSRVDPCSKHLKRKLLDKWMNEHCDRTTTRSVVGIGFWERHRFEGTEKKTGLRQRMVDRGWEFHAPLIYHRPVMDRSDIREWLDREEIDPPDLNEEGFDTNNCGGFCVKMGLTQARHLYFHRNDTYRWHAEQERLAQEAIGTSSTVLARKRGDTKVPLPMIQFGEELDRGEACGLFSQPACGCFFGEDD